MATNQVDKININNINYYISPSPDGVNTFTSNDVAQASSTTWTNITTLSSSDMNSSIFGKISTMFKNLRYLYNVIGTGFNTSNNTITSAVNGKASTVHSHTNISELPVDTQLNNSTASIPSSKVLYDMNERIKIYDDKINNIGSWETTIMAKEKGQFGAIPLTMKINKAKKEVKMYCELSATRTAPSSYNNPNEWQTIIELTTPYPIWSNKPILANSMQSGRTLYLYFYVVGKYIKLFHNRSEYSQDMYMHGFTYLEWKY